jgi:hypothetical protein
VGFAGSIVDIPTMEEPMSTPSQSNTGFAAAAANDEIGPIDIVVIGYPADAPMTGEGVGLLLDLVERGIIRVLDVLFVTAGPDGTYFGFEATDLDERRVGDLVAFEGASSGLLGPEDAATAGEALEPGTSAVVIVYENRWAAPLAAAIRRNGGVLLDNQRIPMQALIGALEDADVPA